jgi:hypothetical protein
MVTNLENVATRPVTAPADTAGGLWSRVVAQFQSAMCGLHGHDPMLQFAEGRMFLRCTSCGHETPGWNTGERRPRPRFTGDATRHQLDAPRGQRPRTLA